MQACVRVLFPLPLPGAYDYLAPEGVRLTPGDFVEAPLGAKKRWGVVWFDSDDDGAREVSAVDPAKLKTVERRAPVPALPGEILAFIAWVARYTMFPAGSVLRLVMRSGDGLTPPKGIIGYRAGALTTVKMTPARQAVLAALAEKDAPMSAADIAARAEVSEGVVRGLAKAGGLTSQTLDPDPPFAPPDLSRHGRPLSAEQATAAGNIAARIAKGGHHVTLIDGVTGSGKTEVYLEAIAAALARDPDAQVLLMLPEIALTLPFLARVEERFGVAPAAWHSDMSAAARRRVWRRVLEGQARLVVGARSALFLPYRKLSLVIVDEEHEGAYKQEDGVIYHARDMAVARGSLGSFPVVLASATPSLETIANVEQGRYELERLKKRFGPAQLPRIDLVDLRKDGPQANEWLSPPLVAAVDDALSKNEQSLLFLNRRGYAPLTICRQCGHRMTAPDSDTWLVEHRLENRLVCHHTGFSMAKPSACPSCKAVGGLTACGPGVERVAEEARSRWPDAAIGVLSSDQVQSASGMRDVLDAMETGALDILVATQMVAKGHHFPNLTLVGVVDADMGLAGGDLRASERTFHLIAQVAGRAGRASRPGRALLQSYRPDASVLQALKNGDRNAFLKAEARGREDLGFPPYGRLAAVILRGRNERQLRDVASLHERAVLAADGVTVWGPAPAPIYRLRGEHRMRFLVKTRRDVNVQAYLGAWLSAVKTPAAVRRSVDVDPYNFL